MRTTEHEHCDQCGFDGSTFDDHELLDAIRGLGPRWALLLGEADHALRWRPSPGVWSALEYAAHSRDITALHTFGVLAALQEDEPVIDDIDDGLIEKASRGYLDEDPLEVCRNLDRQTRQLADVAGEGGATSWTRGLRIGGSRMDVRRLLEHGLHDSTHHLADVEHGLVLLATSTTTPHTA